MGKKRYEVEGSGDADISKHEQEGGVGPNGFGRGATCTEDGSNRVNEAIEESNPENDSQDFSDESAVENDKELPSAPIVVDLGSESRHDSSAISELEEEIEKLRGEIRENYDKYLRSVADLENYKKRVLKERSEMMRYAGEHLVRDILDPVDDLERAVSQQGTVSVDDVVKGIKLILDRFLSVLNKHGVTAADVVFTAFDPATCEALASVPTKDHPPGTVLEQYRKPFYFRDKLIRPGQVVVAVESPDNAADSSSPSGNGQKKEQTIPEGQPE